MISKYVIITLDSKVETCQPKGCWLFSWWCLADVLIVL